jgi:F420-non-reducing hydrogenase large subunit
MVEHVMPGSYMKSVHLRGNPEQRYFVGPLARLQASTSFSTPLATAQLAEFKARIGARLSALDNIEARLIEMVHCAERIVAIASAVGDSGPLAVPVTVKAGRYVGMVEAPRGILIHDFTADEHGRVKSANLLVATQNNYDSINHVITSLARHFKPQGSDELLLNGIEFAIRCFDPCLSCATHAAGAMAMKVELRQGGELLRTLVRQ